MKTRTAPRTKDQNARFHKLIGHNKFEREEKAELVFLVSGGRTRSSAELYEHEMDDAISRLAAPVESSTLKMLAKCYEIYRDIANLPPRKEYTFHQLDFDAINKVIRRCYGKELHRLDYNTLVKAVTTMEKWRDWGLKKAIDSLLNDV